ncbi:MAG TPA: 6-pyruvoyl-tetrahydropterin synthase-related protein, partial [Acidimicrobiales bacterium]|nr:6-pyruvoyl-tetrahydropterin synthase-related protein [Acidimicrobiales bacterium]
HVWGPAYLRDHLLPHGRVTGWTPDWYAGFPYLTFYFPLPSLLIVLVDMVLPYGVAFKLVSVSGLVSLPVAAWAFGRLAGLRDPGPACLAVATVPFLFERSFTIYGGNIASTLAGEFSFSMSLSLALVFLGVVARGLRHESRFEGRHKALAASLLALTLLSHILPTLFAIVGVVVLNAMRPSVRRFGYSLTVGVSAALLTAFWVLPALAGVRYANDMGWEKTTSYLSSLFPSDLYWLVALAGAGAVLSLLFRLRLGVFLLLMAVLTAMAFRWAPDGRLWNARSLPFWFLSLYLLAGVGVAELGLCLGRWLRVDARHWERTGGLVTPVVALIGAIFFVATPLRVLPAWAQVETGDRSFIPDWVRWNYSGYEAKASYGEYRDVVATMGKVGTDVGCGRAFWEYEPELDRLGTPMALMLLPYWTGGCIGSMEGLYFESSATTPYHFLVQAELSKNPSRPQRDLPYGSLDVSQGVEHLRLLGVRYYMALTPEAQEQASGHPDLRLVASSGPWDVRYDDGVKQRTWQVYEVSGSEVVAPLGHEPVVVKGLDAGGRTWQDAAVAWFRDPARLDVPLAADGPKEWPRIEPSAAEAPRRPIPRAEVSGIRTDDDRISFDVDRPGTPVLVKASHFPNWRASGARGPWRVTPNLMVVVPTSSHVELRYATTGAESLGWALSLLGLVAVVVFGARGSVGRGCQGEEPGGEPDDETPAVHPDDHLVGRHHEPLAVGAATERGAR